MVSLTMEDQHVVEVGQSGEELEMWKLSRRGSKNVEAEDFKDAALHGRKGADNYGS
jgi:hypothetical protein